MLITCGCGSERPDARLFILSSFRPANPDLRLNSVMVRVRTIKPSVQEWRSLLADCACGDNNLDFWCYRLIRGLLLDLSDDVDDELYEALSREIELRPEVCQFVFSNEFDGYQMDAKSLDEYIARDDRFLVRACDSIDSCDTSLNAKSRFGVILLGSALMRREWIALGRQNGANVAWNQVRREIYRHGDYYRFQWRSKQFELDEQHLQRREAIPLIDQEPINPETGVSPESASVRLISIP